MLYSDPGHTPDQNKLCTLCCQLLCTPCYQKSCTLVAKSCVFQITKNCVLVITDYSIPQRYNFTTCLVADSGPAVRRTT